MDKDRIGSKPEIERYQGRASIYRTVVTYKANQRVSQTVTDNSWINYPAATPAVSYTANALNQYTAVGAVTPAYDAENRLISAVGAGNTASYSYDAQGRRKTRTVNSTTTVFVTDAGNREVLEYDGSNGTIQRWYAYGLGSNDVLNQTNVVAGTRTAFIPDIQGSVIASLDSSSGTLSKIGYLPYGKGASATGPFGYTAQRIDPETNGLYYYRARHYSPAWGRFMQPDPIGYGGGVNLYAYVNNDPLNATDPLGLYSTLVVTLPNGTQYTPMTTVKNSAQAAATSYGVPVGTNVPIAVPPGVNPQTMVNQWGSGSLFNGPAEFAYLASER